MKKTISLLLTVAAVLTLFTACGNTGYRQSTTTISTTAAKTTTTTEASPYPTENECVSAINEVYEEYGNEVSHDVRLVFNSHIDKSAKYDIMLDISEGGWLLGSVMMSSPISPDKEGYGYITGISITSDLSKLEFTAGTVDIILNTVLRPVYAYAKNWGGFSGDYSSFYEARSLYKETNYVYVYEISGYDAVLCANKTKLTAAAAYGKLESEMIKTSAY